MFYDGDGMRLRATTGSQPTNYLWDLNPARAGPTARQYDPTTGRFAQTDPLAGPSDH